MGRNGSLKIVNYRLDQILKTLFLFKEVPPKSVQMCENAKYSYFYVRVDINVLCMRQVIIKKKFS